MNIIIFRFFNNCIKRLISSQKQKKLLNDLNIGDLVWAKMPLSKKELSTIQESHQTRPYLIVNKDWANIYAFYCSSKQTNNLNNYQEYFVNKLRYNQNKDSWINLTTVFAIPINNLKSKYISLNKYDLKNIQKRLNILSHKYNKMFQFHLDIYISEGDIISIEKQLYYVYASDNCYLYCFIIFKKRPKNQKNYNSIIVNNKTYYTTFKEKINFLRTRKMNIINIAYKSEIEAILEKKNGIEFNSNIKKKMNEKSYESIYKSGTVFQVGKLKIVYLFKYKSVHYGLDLLMYKIKSKLIPIFNIEKRQIIEILPSEEYLKIVEFLLLNNIQPSREINLLYQEIREVIYN